MQLLTVPRAQFEQQMKRERERERERGRERDEEREMKRAQAIITHPGGTNIYWFLSHIGGALTIYFILYNALGIKGTACNSSKNTSILGRLTLL